MPDYIVHKAVELSALSSKVAAGLEAEQDWIISPKYDGCHAVICFDSGKFIRAYSRSGETCYSLDHVAADLLRVYPDLSNGRWAICGEAWHPHKPFNEISGLFRKQKDVTTTLYFVPFDVVPWDYNDESTAGPVVVLNPRGCGPAYSKRLQWLTSQVSVPYSSVAAVWSTHVRGTLSYAYAEAAKVAAHYKGLAETIGSHYDGAILANANGKYAVGSGKGGEFIKAKPLASYSVQVAGHEAAVGEKTGKNTVALTFVLDGKLQRVSTGLTQAQVDEIVAQPDSWVGQTIEVEAMGITSGGFLREPRFKGLRSDA